MKSNGPVNVDGRWLLVSCFWPEADSQLPEASSQQQEARGFY
jgi:hypothetical protein